MPRDARINPASFLSKLGPKVLHSWSLYFFDKIMTKQNYWCLNILSTFVVNQAIPSQLQIPFKHLFFDEEGFQNQEQHWECSRQAARQQRKHTH